MLEEQKPLKRKKISTFSFVLFGLFFAVIFHGAILRSATFLADKFLFGEARQWQVASDTPGTKIRQEVNIVFLQPGVFGSLNTQATSAGHAALSPSQFDGTVEYRFEIVARNTNTTLPYTVNLVNNANDSFLSRITIPPNTTAYTRFRSEPFVPTDDMDVYANIVQTAAANNVIVNNARVIITQQDFNKTETAIDIGNHESGKANTATSSLTYPKFWYYDSSKWDGTISFYAEVSYMADLAGTNVVAVLQEDDGSFGSWTNKITIVNNGNFTGDYTRVRVPFTPTSGRNYRLATKCSANTYRISGSRIIVQQEKYIDSIVASTTSAMSIFGGTTGSNEAIAQPFVATTSYRVSGMSLLMDKQGSPTDYNYIEIREGSPTGTLMGTSDTIPASLATTTPRWVKFSFSTPTETLASSTTYFIVCYRTGALDVTNRLRWIGSDMGLTPNGGYARNSTVWDSGQAAVDLGFKTYTPNVGITKLETGYLVLSSYKNATGLSDADTYFDPSEWSGVTNTYYHETNATTTDANDSAKLQSNPNVTPLDVTNSTSTGTNRSRSGSLTMPTTAQDIDTNVLNVPIYGSRIVVQVNINAIQNLTQNNFRWRDDNGSETTASWLALQNTSAWREQGSTTRLRVILDNGIDNASSTKYQLEYKKSTDMLYKKVETLQTPASATPVVMATSSGRTSAANVNAHFITLPPNIQPGDLLLVIFSSDGVPGGTANVGDIRIDTDGWTKLGYQVNTTNIVSSAVFYKFATGGDAPPVVTTVGSTVALGVEQSSHIVYRISGAGVPLITGVGGNSTNSNPPVLNTGVSKNYMWIATRSGDSTTLATVAPTNFTKLYSMAAIGTASASTNSAQYASSTASLDPGTFTSLTEQWVSFTIAIPPSSMGIKSSDIPVTGTTNLSVPYPTNITPGDLIVLPIANRTPTNSPVTPTGWKALTNYQVSGGAGAEAADAGMVYSTVFVREADGTEFGNLDISIPSGTATVGEMILYKKEVSKVWDIAMANGSDVSAGTAWSVTANADPGITVGDRILVASVANTDGYGYYAHSLAATGATISTNQEIFENASTTLGNDLEMVVSEHYVAAGTASAAPVFTMTASGAVPAGASVFVRIRQIQPQIQLALSSNIAASGASTTVQLTPPSGKATSTNFAEGRIQDDENPADAIDLASQKYTEMEWSIVATGTAVDGEVYDFRVTASGTPIDSYSVTPQLSIGTPSVTTVLNTEDAHVFQGDTTPTLEMTGTDPDGQDVRYNIQINSTSTFGTSWDVSAASYDSKSYNETVDGTPIALAFNSDGTKMYIIGYINMRVHSYSLSTPWDVSSTVIYISNHSVVAEDTNPHSIAFNSDGTKMYIMGNMSDTVYQYDVSPAWDVSTTTVTYASKSYTQSQDVGGAYGLSFNSDGTRMYILGNINNRVYQYTLTTPWDVSTANYTVPKNYMVMEDSDLGSVHFNSDGTKMYILGMSSDTVYQYTLTTPWDVSTANYTVPKYYNETQDTEPRDAVFSSDGSKMYVMGSTNDRVYQYTLGTSPLLDKFSDIDEGFLNTASSTNVDPFTSGEKVSFTVHNNDALTVGTYYWRARAKDPTGSDTYGNWATTRSFTVSDAISGHVYNYASTTALTDCDADTGTYELAMKLSSTSTIYNASCDDATGEFVFTGYPTVSSTTNFVIWINDEATDGSLSLRHDGVSSLSGLTFWGGRVTVSASGTSTATNTTLDTFDENDDLDIPYNVTGGNASISDGFDLYIAAGKTFTPGGTINTTPTSDASTQNGDVIIGYGATFAMGANALAIGGDFRNFGTFTHTGTATFNALTTGVTIDAGTSLFYNLTFNGSGGGWSFGSATQVGGNLSMTDGTLTSSNDLTVQGGTMNGNGVITFFDGTILENIKQIDGGISHTCAVSNAGIPYCWGKATDGRLGDDQDSSDRIIPIRVHAGAATSTDNDGTYLTNIKEIFGGNSHSCALSNSGYVYCWGWAGDGELGDGQTAASQFTPVQVLAGVATGADKNGLYLANIRHITTGDYHTCAVSNTGKMYCWGNATDGRLGDNQEAVDKSTPVLVEDGQATGANTNGTNLINVKEISAGDAHTCASTNNGRVYCWGWAGDGQLGDGQIATPYFTPRLVQDGEATGADTDGTSLLNIQQISVGGHHTCALSNTGKAYCWGMALYGRIGDGDTVDRTTPVLVEDGEATGADTDGVNLINIREISGGYQHTCALSHSGKTYCWGRGTDGRLGDDQDSSDRLTPVAVYSGDAMSANSDGSHLVNMQHITTGGYHTCATTNIGKTYCFGWGGDGQLGDNDNTSPRWVPTNVNAGAAAASDFDGVNLTNAKKVSAVGNHTCALSNTGKAYCWGSAEYGQLGDNQIMTNRLMPVRVLAGMATTTTTDSDGTYLINIQSISVGYSSTCALSNTGSVYCWGQAIWGAIGDNQIMTNRLMPVRVRAGMATTTTTDSDGTYLTNIQSIDAGDNHVCAVSNAGNAYCWGRASYGILGNNQSTTDRTTPIRVLAGMATTTTTDSDGTYLTNIQSIDAGAYHTCAISNAGNAYCWGQASFGKIGDNQSATDRLMPVRVLKGAATTTDNDGTYLTNIQKISGGDYHTCAVSNANNAYCWGRAVYGQIGDNSTTTDRLIPVRVLKGAAATTDTDGTNLVNIQSISSGGGHTCAISNANNAYCWGRVINGQLGDGQKVTNRITPVRVLKGDAATTDTDGTNFVNIQSIIAGGYYTCAVSNAGNAYCWGSPLYGKLGDNQSATDRTTPVYVFRGVSKEDTSDSTYPFFTLLGSGNFGGSSTWSFVNLAFGDATTTATTISSGTGDMNISRSLTIKNTHTLNAGLRSWILSGGGTPFSILGGTLTASSSTFRYTGTIDTTIATTTYYNLELEPSGGAPTYTIATGTLAVTNNLTLGDGSNAVTVNANSTDPTVDVNGVFLVSANAIYQASDTNTLSIGGNFTNSGTFVANTGTTTFAGTTQQTIAGNMIGSNAFYTLKITNNSGSDPVTSPSIIFTSPASSTNFIATTASTKIRFQASNGYTFTNFYVNGQNTTSRIALRSSSTGTPWYLYVTGTQSVKNTNPQDSNAIGGNEILANNGTSQDGTGNTNWNFGDFGGRLFSSGFEQQSAADNVEWSGLTEATPVTISTTVRRSGLASAEAKPITSGVETRLSFDFKTGDTLGIYYGRVYLYVDTLPTAENVITTFRNDSDSDKTRIGLGSDAKLYLRDADGLLIGSASPALELKKWYRVEFKMANPTVSNYGLEAKLDGVVFASGTTTLDVTDGNRTIAIGANLELEAQTTGKWYFDDVAVNEASGTYQNNYPGEGSIVHLRAESVGDNDAWTNNVGYIDEIIPNDATDYISVTTLDAIEDVGIMSPVDSGLSSEDTITLVSVGLRFVSSDTAVYGAKVRLKSESGGSVIESNELFQNSTTWDTNAASTPKIYPIVAYRKLNGSTWTAQDLTQSQIGVQLTTDPGAGTLNVSSMWALVEYVSAMSVAVDHIQLLGDLMTILPTGSSTSDGITTNLHLNFWLKSSILGDLMMPRVEVKDTATSFADVLTAGGTQSCEYGAGTPGQRSAPAVINDTANNRLIVFAGNEDITGVEIYQNDVWELKLFSGTRLKPCWRKLAPSGTAPTGRNYPACIYDEVNQRMVCFGGWNGGPLGGFYELTLPSNSDGAWTTLTPAGTVPTNRYTEAVYDSTYDRMIIFGGYSTADLRDLYSVTLPGVGQNGTSTRYTDAPVTLEIRSEHSIIYDTTNATPRLVIFGGWGSTGYNDTWTVTLPSDLSTKSWVELSPTGTLPAVRHAHEAVYDPTNDRMIVIGGQYGNAGTYYDDIQALSLTSGSEAWTNISPSVADRPVMRKGTAGVYDDLNDRLIFFGGKEGDGGQYFTRELLALSLPSTGSTTVTNIPPRALLSSRDAARMVYDAENERAILFSGYAGHLYVDAASDSGMHTNEGWFLDVSSSTRPIWKDIPYAEGPLRRELASVVMDTDDNRMIVFGGTYSDKYRLGDVWSLSLDSQTLPMWTKLTPTGVAPSPRWGAATAYDTANDRMIIYGGEDNSDAVLSDTWALDLSTPGAESWDQLSPSGTGPGVEWGATAVYDATNTRMLIFGGEDGADGYSYEVHELDTSTTDGTWTSRTPGAGNPTARRGHSAIVDEPNSRMIMFGGYGGSYTAHYNDVWSLDISADAVSWTQLNPSGSDPAARRSHAATYDSTNHRMIIFGGRGIGESGELNNVPFFNDVWGLDLASGAETWIPFAPPVYLHSSVAVTGLAEGTNFHWQSWMFGSISGTSTFASFGANVESATDFLTTGGVEPPQSLSFNISSNFASFGSLLSGSTKYASSTGQGSLTEVAAHSLTASTTASNGYTITVRGEPLKSGSNVINAIGSSYASSTTGIKQFGMRISASGGLGQSVYPYNAPTSYAFGANSSTPSIIAQSTTASTDTTYNLYYMSNVGTDTQAGQYNTVLTYIITGNF